MAELINVTSPLTADANEGRIVSNPERMGNRRYGQKVFLSGTEAPIATDPPIYDWYGFETITVSSTALALTENLSELADTVIITIESQVVRYRVDGQNPTATVGHELSGGDALRLTGRFEIDKFRVIRRDGTDATARVSYGQRRYA